MSDPTSKYVPSGNHGARLDAEHQKIKRAIDGLNSVTGPFTIFSGPLNINSGGMNVVGASTLPQIVGPTTMSTVLSLSGALLTITGNSGVGMVTGNWLGSLRLTGTSGTIDMSGVDMYSGSNTVPGARIGASFTGSGSTIRFGVSNNYATGITHDIFRAGFDAAATFTLKTYSPNQAGLIDDTADTGSSTVTLTGFTALTGTATWARKGSQVSIKIPILLGTSTATTMTLTGLPASLAPSTDVYGLCFTKNNATFGISPWKMAAGSSTITFSNGYAGIFPAAFTNAAANGLPLGFTWTYNLG